MCLVYALIDYLQTFWLCTAKFLSKLLRLASFLIESTVRRWVKWSLSSLQSIEWTEQWEGELKSDEAGTSICCALPRDVRLKLKRKVKSFEWTSGENLPLSTWTLMIATIAFDGEQEYFPELVSSAFWISKWDVVTSPFRVSIEIPPRNVS